MHQSLRAVYFLLINWNDATFLLLSLIIIYSLENEEDTLHNPTELDSTTILNECKKDLNSKRRPSLAQKMTSNLRRLSGAADLKIDIGDPMNANNSKYCNKKIKVNTHTHPARLICALLRNSPEARPEKKNYNFLSCFQLFPCDNTAPQHSRHDGGGECDSSASRDPATQYRRAKISIECGTR